MFEDLVVRDCLPDHRPDPHEGEINDSPGSVEEKSARAPGGYLAENIAKGQRTFKASERRNPQLGASEQRRSKATRKSRDSYLRWKRSHSVALGRTKLCDCSAIAATSAAESISSSQLYKVTILLARSFSGTQERP